MNTRLRSAILCCGLTAAAFAQGRPGSQNHPPVIGKDGSVTFTIEQPNAQEVRFFSDFGGGGKMPPMRKSGNLWTHTTEPEEPGTYHYSFLVDGVLTPDPSSIAARDWRSFIPWINVIEIRGSEPLVHDPNLQTPHGRIQVEQLASAIVGKPLPLLVYTPAGYENSQKQYPVIYLLHGSDGVAWQWSSDGRMEHMADNLIAAGKMPEAILVSPDANMPGNSFAAFERYMVEEVIPFVEARYRTLAAASGRMIVGASRGGNQAFHVALKRPDLFSALGVFSINLGVLNTQTYASLSDPAALNQQFRVFLYAGGTGDNLIAFPSVQAAHDKLVQLGVTHTFMAIPGDHAWQNWRKLFVEFVGRL